MEDRYIHSLLSENDKNMDNLIDMRNFIVDILSVIDRNWEFNIKANSSKIKDKPVVKSILEIDVDKEVLDTYSELLEKNKTSRK